MPKDPKKCHPLSSSELQEPEPEPERQRPKRVIRYRHRVLLKRDIAPFAWPIGVELICVVLMSMISTILVSRIGKSETAAVGISDSITFIVISMLSAIALGGSVFIAQSFAKRNQKNSRLGAVHTVNLNIAFSLISCLIVYTLSHPLLRIIAYGADPEVIQLTDLYLKTIAFSYPALAIIFAGSGILRAVGNSRLPAISNVLMNILNIGLSYPLIYGFNVAGIQWAGLGIQGAGIGITLARWSGAMIILLFLAKNHTFHLPLKTYFQPFHRDILGDILSIGIPASVESMMFNIGKLITQIMVAGMGTVAMAGNVIAFSIVLLLNIPGNTLAMTSTVLIGKRLGQDRSKFADQEMRLIFWVSTGLLVLLAVCSAPFAEWIARCYTDDPDVINVVVNLIYLNAAMMSIWTASFVLPSAFKGAKDVKYCMWTSIASMWGCRVVLGYLLGIGMGFGIYGIWLGMFADWWIRGGLYFYRMITHRWLTKYHQQR